LVLRHQRSLRQSGLSHISSTLSRASHLKLDQIKACHEQEKTELNRLLSQKDTEISHFHNELEVMMREMEDLQREAARRR